MIQHSMAEQQTVIYCLLVLLRGTMKIKLTLCSLFILFLFVRIASSQNDIDPGQQSTESNDVQFHALPFHSQDTLQRALGLSLGSVRVYTKDHGFSYAGYGEFLYHWYSHDADWHVTNLHPQFEVLPTNKDSELSLLRGVLF